jgi:ferredoxin
MHDDGLAYVKEVSWPNRFGSNGTGDTPALKMSDGMANIPEALLQDVIESAEECPGECIFIDVS